jgi:V-type H+-transporting ATPase subunit a
MALGVALKGLNYRYQKKTVDFWFEFVPQLVMLFALFGFMDLLIIIKWTTDFEETPSDPSQAGLKAPSIVSTMIAMVLGFGEQSDLKLKERDLIGSQTAIMRTLLVIIFLCVPTMLFVKPYHEFKKMKQSHTHEEPRNSERHVNTDQLYYAINADTYEDSQFRSTVVVPR